MKNILLLVLLIFSSLCVYSQYDMITVDKIQYMFDYFNSGFVVQEHYNSICYIDDATIYSATIITRLSYLLRTLETFFKYEDPSRIYLKKYQATIYINKELEIIFYSSWLTKYYSIKDSEAKTNMLIDLFYEQYNSFKTEQSIQTYR